MQLTVRALVRSVVPARWRPRLRAAYERCTFRELRYRCPCCRGRFRAFRSFGLDIPVLERLRVVGGGCRPNALCPICGSLDRERLVYLFLLHRTDLLRRPGRVLHVAPETHLGQVLRRHLGTTHVTADLNRKEVSVRLDVTDIPFSDRCFDAIVCNHVLEHVPDDRRAMSELHRVLKPGGFAILQVPLSATLERTYEDPSIVAPEAREQAFGQPDHVRIYGRDYADRLRAAGFEVELFAWRSAGETFGGPENRYGLNAGEPVVMVRKSVAEAGS